MGTVEETADHRNRLGYDTAWLEYGFLDATTLSAQIAAFQSGDDTNTEHFRYATFHQILASREAMDDATIARYLHLVEIDADESMAHAALCDLLQWNGLTESQWATLSQHPLLDTPVCQKLILRRHLLKALKADSVSEATFAECLAFSDDPVQRCLVSHKAVTPAQLQVLAENGVNKAVRNLAKVHLRNRS